MDTADSVLDVLRTVGLKDETIARLLGEDTASASESEIDDLAEQFLEAESETDSVGEATAALLRDSPLGIDLPREYTPAQLETALAGALDYHEHSLELSFSEGSDRFSDVCVLGRFVDGANTDFPREIGIEIDDDEFYERFHRPVESDRRRTFVAFMAFFDRFPAWHRELAVVRLRTADDRLTAAVLSRSDFKTLRDDDATVAVDGQVVCDLIPLAEIGPPRHNLDKCPRRCRTVHMEYFVPPGTPKSDFGRDTREMTAALERFGPETSTIFHNLQSLEVVDGLNSPAEIEHVYDSLESRIRLYTVVQGDYPPESVGKHYFTAAEAIVTAPFTARLDARSLEHVRWFIPEAFEHYGYELRFQYPDGTSLDARHPEDDADTDRFEVHLETPDGEHEQVELRYSNLKIEKPRAISVDATLSAINRELLAEVPLEIFMAKNGSGMGTYTVVDTETFDGHPATVTVGTHQLLEPLSNRLDS